MSTTAVVGVKSKSVVTGRLQTVVLTLIDKDTEIIDDYQNYYALAPLFQRDDYSLINDEVINTSKDKSIVPQALASTVLSLIGSGLIVYDYPTVGVLLNLAISLPFIYTSNRIEHKAIDGKNRLISKIKADLDNFKL